MHYGAGAFSSNGLDTITVLPPNEAWQGLIGQRTHMSEYDKITLSYIYREPDWHFVKSTQTLISGTFFLPWNSFGYGYSQVPDGGRLIFLDSATYSAVGLYTKAVTLDAANGLVTLGS